MKKTRDNTLIGRCGKKNVEVELRLGNGNIRVWKRSWLADWVAEKTETHPLFRKFSSSYDGIFTDEEYGKTASFLLVCVSLVVGLLFAAWQPFLLVLLIPTEFILKLWVKRQLRKSNQTKSKSPSYTFNCHPKIASNISTLGVQDFPIEHAVELYNALSKMEKGREILDEIKLEKYHWTLDDSFLPLLENGIQEKEENLALAQEELEEVCSKINNWYQARKEEKFMALLDKRC